MCGLPVCKLDEVGRTARQLGCTETCIVLLPELALNINREFRFIKLHRDFSRRSPTNQLDSAFVDHGRPNIETDLSATTISFRQEKTNPMPGTTLLIHERFAESISFLSIFRQKKPTSTQTNCDYEIETVQHSCVVPGFTRSGTHAARCWDTRRRHVINRGFSARLFSRNPNGARCLVEEPQLVRQCLAGRILGD